MISKGSIEKNFSRHAENYDRYSGVQNICAEELISKIGAKDLSGILDIGCGTGSFTKLLKGRFPNSDITALDISRDMLRVAREKLKTDRIEFIEDDARTAIFDKGFDLICSNAALQWIDYLERTLVYYKKMLKPDGSIWFSIFGQDTFFELGRAIKAVFGDKASISASNFIKRDKLKSVMEGHFSNARVDERSYEERYENIRGLLDRIRFTGTRGYGVGNGMAWTRKRIEELESAYIERFGEIRATYQVFFCGGNR